MREKGKAMNSNQRSTYGKSAFSCARLYREQYSTVNREVGRKRKRKQIGDDRMLQPKGFIHPWWFVRKSGRLARLAM